MISIVFNNIICIQGIGHLDQISAQSKRYFRNGNPDFHMWKGIIQMTLKTLIKGYKLNFRKYCSLKIGILTKRVLILNNNMSFKQNFMNNISDIL